MHRKIDAMHDIYGYASGTCKDCSHLVRIETPLRRYYKCAAYGESASEATDWRLYWQACMLCFTKLPPGHIPVLERIKHASRPSNAPVEGQITMEV